VITMCRPTIDEIKSRLKRYPAIRMEMDNMLSRLEILRSEETLPPMRQGDGSKMTAGTGDRQERAILRRMEYEERIAPTIAANKQEIKALDAAVLALPDPLEREVITIHYIEVDGYKPLPWREVAIAMFGDDSDAKLLAVHRLHGKALQSLQEILQGEESKV
jgi:hypothetical protein